MKKNWLLTTFIVLLFLLSTIPLESTSETISSSNPPVDRSSSSLSLTSELTEAKGVVLIDDIHDNDYADSDLTRAKDTLNDLGYISKFSSEFSSWTGALDVAHYLILGAPYSSISTADIDAIETWFSEGTKQMLLASRGDFAMVDYTSMNAILTAVNSSIEVQNDNVYTTDESARQEWYVDTSNFNTSYAGIFEGVQNINFFSPSSIKDTNTSNVMVYAEADAYQTNQNGDPADVIYDDTADGIGGTGIPLTVHEEINDQDQVIVTGTTMWSNFDYGDGSADDTIFFSNIIDFFREKLLEAEGSITIDLPDPDAPEVDIAFPRADSTIFGIINVSVDVFDPFGVDSISILLNSTEVSTSSYFVWDTTLYNDGIYNLTVSAVDSNANYGSTTHILTIDQDFQPSLEPVSKVMTYNIKESGIFPEWLNVIKQTNPDVVVLVETGDFDDNMNDLLELYTTQLNDYFLDEVAYQSYTLQGINSRFDGITILSRYDITDAQKLNSLPLDDETTIGIPLPFLHAELEVNNSPLHVIGAHLTCCPGTTNELARENQQEAILNYMDNLGDVPILYMGDMNAESHEDVSDSDLGTAPIEMVLDSSHPKAAETHQFIDVYKTLNPEDVDPTYVGNVESRIDFVFANQYFWDDIISADVPIVESVEEGSDHRPVLAEIDFTDFPGEAAEFTTPETSGSTTPSSEDTGEVELPQYIMGVLVLAVIPILRRKNHN